MTASKQSTDVRTQNDDMPEEATMTETTTTAKKTATRKPAAKKPAARKPATRKAPVRKARTRKPRTIKPMSPAMRAVAAEVVGASVTAVMTNDELGVKRESTTELKGNRQGMKSRVVLDDGTVITTTVTVR